MRQRTRKADWQTWTDVRQATAWEAVALSMNIEPKTLNGLDFRPISGGPFDDCSDKFQRCIKIACSHIDSGELAVVRHGGKMYTDVVALSVFATWATSVVKWKIPPGLSALAIQPDKQDAPTAALSPKPLQRQLHQEQEILRIIRERGYSPKALPKREHGKTGVKAKVKSGLPDFSVCVFNKAWQRLRDQGEIKES